MSSLKQYLVVRGCLVGVDKQVVSVAAGGENGANMRRGYCKHFTGIMDDECEKGINYRAMCPGPSMGWATRLPCRKKNGRQCGGYQESTQEEIEAEEAALIKSLEPMSQAIQLIKKETGAEPCYETWDELKKGANGFIECPKCGSPLHYTVSGGNHHIHGQCSTENCLGWMM